MTTAKTMNNLNTVNLIQEDRKLLLIDMDGVIANWQKMFDDLLTLHYPHIPLIPTEEVISFKTQKFYAQEHQSDIAKMMDTPGYYRDLLPYEGAVEALWELENNYNVFLCTAPYLSNATCASEKLEWVGNHLGSRWMNKAVITSDKTLVRGHVLVDDKPNIKGAMVPTWEHIVFDAPYNRDKELRINNWSEGVEVIDKVMRNIA